MYNYNLSLLIFVILPVVFAQNNYCSKTLCEPGKQHIACNNYGYLQASCGSNPQVISMTSNLRNLIVNKHNMLRNQVAKGFAQYKPAKRMATMRWSPELAQLAELNVKQCRLKHDQCRNTNEFKFAGQNLAASSWRGMKRAITNVIESQIQMWFNEYKDGSMSIIKKYSRSANGKAIGHFTAMIQQKSTHVGCAVLRHLRSDGFTEQLMACNYAYTNVLGSPVYKAGTATSKCETGVNPNYRFLCSVEEHYNVNTV
ncbi:venom allergen-1-like [Cochliomyia hominivorax]